MKELETILKDVPIVNDIALITNYGSILLDINYDKKIYKYISTELLKEYKKIKNLYIKREVYKKYLKPFINNKPIKDNRSIIDIIKKGVNTAGIAVTIVNAYEHKEDLLKLENYYHTALNAKEIYKDTKVYTYLRRECIKTFNGLKDKRLKDEIVKYIDPEFLKYK